MKPDKRSFFSENDFKLLFDKWNRRIYNYALLKTKSSYIAEEVVQRTLIKLWNNINTKNVDVSIDAQVFCITKTVILDVLKQENRRKYHTLESTKTTVKQETPVDIYNLKELHKTLHLHIEKMPTMRRQVFIMSRIEQFSYKEIAQKLEITTKTVENHLNIALKYLKKSMLVIIIFIYIFF